MWVAGVESNKPPAHNNNKACWGLAKGSTPATLVHLPASNATSLRPKTRQTLNLRKALPVMRTITVVRCKTARRRSGGISWNSSAIGRETQAMSQTNSKRSTSRKLALLAVWPAALLLTGCQVEMAGQTLPSPYYLTDDIQYYAPAPSEFKLSREAAAIQEQNEAIRSQRQEAQTP
jgi:hypothetical protein